MAKNKLLKLAGVTVSVPLVVFATVLLALTFKQATAATIPPEDNVFNLVDDGVGGTGGDCMTHMGGTWDGNTKTCVLREDLSGFSVHLDSNYLTLDCKNYKISAEAAEGVVYSLDSIGNTVQNCLIKSTDGPGINLNNSEDGKILNNEISSANSFGIIIDGELGLGNFADKNKIIDTGVAIFNNVKTTTLTNNNITNSNIGILLGPSSTNTTLIDNLSCNDGPDSIDLQIDGGDPGTSILSFSGNTGDTVNDPGKSGFTFEFQCPVDECADTLLYLQGLGYTAHINVDGAMVVVYNEGTANAVSVIYAETCDAPIIENTLPDTIDMNDATLTEATIWGTAYVATDCDTVKASVFALANSTADVGTVTKTVEGSVEVIATDTNTPDSIEKIAIPMTIDKEAAEILKYVVLGTINAYGNQNATFIKNEIANDIEGTIYTVSSATGAVYKTADLTYDLDSLVDVPFEPTVRVIALAQTGVLNARGNLGADFAKCNYSGGLIVEADGSGGGSIIAHKSISIDPDLPYSHGSPALVGSITGILNARGDFVADFAKWNDPDGLIVGADGSGGGNIIAHKNIWVDNDLLETPIIASAITSMFDARGNIEGDVYYDDVNDSLVADVNKLSDLGDVEGYKELSYELGPLGGYLDDIGEPGSGGSIPALDLSATGAIDSEGDDILKYDLDDSEPDYLTLENAVEVIIKYDLNSLHIPLQLNFDALYAPIVSSITEAVIESGSSDIFMDLDEAEGYYLTLEDTIEIVVNYDLDSLVSLEIPDNDTFIPNFLATIRQATEASLNTDKQITEPFEIDVESVTNNLRLSMPGDAVITYDTASLLGFESCYADTNLESIIGASTWGVIEADMAGDQSFAHVSTTVPEDASSESPAIITEFQAGDNYATSISIYENDIESELLATTVQVASEQSDITDSTALIFDEEDSLVQLYIDSTKITEFESPLLTRSVEAEYLHTVLTSLYETIENYDSVLATATTDTLYIAQLIFTAGVEIYTIDGGPYVTAQQLAQFVYDLFGFSTLTARCGVRGQVNQACGENTEVTLHLKSCAVTWNNDPADVAANCASFGAFTEDPDMPADDKFRYYTGLVPYGEYFLVAMDPDLLDPMDNPIYSSHPTVNIPDDTFANVIMHVKPDGKNQGMKSKKKTGSELWIYEPTDVVWVNDIEYYPFYFESDSDWTIDVCMEVPEGYEIIEGEECSQVLVANEEKEILFKVVEVGSIPYDSIVDWEFVRPDGKKIKEQSKIGVRLHPSLAKAKKLELLEKGYEIDEKGRVKKIQ